MGLKDLFRKLRGKEQSDDEAIQETENENRELEEASGESSDLADEETLHSSKPEESQQDESQEETQTLADEEALHSSKPEESQQEESQEETQTLADEETLHSSKPEESQQDESQKEAQTLADEETSHSSKPEESKQDENQEEAPKKKGFFARLSEGLTKTRNSIGGLFDSVFSGSELDDDFFDELEEILIIADVGAATTQEILSKLRERIKIDRLKTPEEAREVLREILADIMRPDTPFVEDEKSVILIVGVNGVGKTTSIGKLAHYYSNHGKKVMLAAGDTFRAAATEQLMEWGKRADVPVVKHGEGADSAAVVYDAIHSAQAKDCDMLICDTAGRLHNKKNLMSELSKIGRVISREYPEARVESLLVLDATTGQNAISQAKAFSESVPLTGIVLTKLDGTAKGGVVIAIKQDTGLPVRFIGVGEGLDDLQPFNQDDFIKALF